MGIFRTAVTLSIAAGLVAASKLVSLDTLLSHASSFHPSATAVTYYVSPNGNDKSAGTSPSHPWRTLARASVAKLQPGDSLLLQGNHVFTGVLQIGKSDSGTATHHVLIGSYGTGRATISSSSNGVVVYDAANLTISNLVIIGRQAMRPGTAGIQVYSDLQRTRLGHLLIERVDASGFGYGVAIGGAHYGAGFSNVWVEQSSVHRNLDAGLITYGPAFNPKDPSYANAGVHVWRVRAYGNLGDPANTSSNSGSGIVLGNVSGATVTMSSAYDNGGKGGAPQQGPEGIWTYDASHVVIEHNVSHDNSSNSQVDGGGFDFDQGTTDSVIEYNLSYGNHGPGYLLYGSQRIPQRGNVVRFNISCDDGHSNFDVGGIALGGRTADLAVYQNTVVMAKTGPQSALKLNGTPISVRVLNNIFVGSAGGPVVWALSPLTRSDVLLAGNDYQAPAGNWSVQWATAVYDSLSTWRGATSEELVSGKPTGLIAPPLFVNPNPAKAAGAGFVLKRGSALRGAGLGIVRLFGVNPGKVNYGGKPYLTGHPNVGAQ
jgi:hypothetical protein